MDYSGAGDSDGGLLAFTMVGHARCVSRAKVQ
jgi:hypothetical protein